MRNASSYKTSSIFKNLALFVLPFVIRVLLCAISLVVLQLSGWTPKLIALVGIRPENDIALITFGAIVAGLAFFVALIFAAKLRAELLERINLRKFPANVLSSCVYLNGGGLQQLDIYMRRADDIVEVFEQDRQSTAVRLELARVFGMFQGLMKQNPIVAFWASEAMREALNAHAKLPLLSANGVST